MAESWPSRMDLADEIEKQASLLATWTSNYDRLERELREAKGERERAQINMNLAIRALRDWSPPPEKKK